MSKSEKTENKMKSKIDWKTVRIVTITLVTVAAFVATFLLGMNYEAQQNDKINAKAATIVKSVKVEVSKQ